MILCGLCDQELSFLKLSKLYLFPVYLPKLTHLFRTSKHNSFKKTALPKAHLLKWTWTGHENHLLSFSNSIRSHNHSSYIELCQEVSVDIWCRDWERVECYNDILQCGIRIIGKESAGNCSGSSLPENEKPVHHWFWFQVSYVHISEENYFVTFWTGRVSTQLEPTRRPGQKCWRSVTNKASNIACYKRLTRITP